MSEKEYQDLRKKITEALDTLSLVERIAGVKSQSAEILKTPIGGISRITFQLEVTETNGYVSQKHFSFGPGDLFFKRAITGFYAICGDVNAQAKEAFEKL